MMQPGYTERSSNDPRGVGRDGGGPEGSACNGFCAEPCVSARAAVEAATRMAGLLGWMAGVKADRLLGEIMPAVLPARP